MIGTRLATSSVVVVAGLSGVQMVPGGRSHRDSVQTIELANSGQSSCSTLSTYRSKTLLWWVLWRSRVRRALVTVSREALRAEKSGVRHVGPPSYSS